MSSDDVTTLFAVLAGAGVVVLVVLVVAVAVPSLRATLTRLLTGQGVPVAWLVAAVATLGSLYLSEVAHFPPCRLCWFQRIAMYPLVVVLAAAWRWRDVSARVAALVLAGLGLVVNLWHVAVEIRPTLEGGSCDPANPCSLRWVEALGFWTIPRMATVAFLLVLALLLLDRPRRVDRRQDVPFDPHQEERSPA
jgi:disulfide bond formation protein DsbB